MLRDRERDRERQREKRQTERETGATSLNGDVTLAAEKKIIATAGTGELDFSLATGDFKTSTGAVTLGRERQREREGEREKEREKKEREKEKNRKKTFTHVHTQTRCSKTRVMSARCA